MEIAKKIDGLIQDLGFSFRRESGVEGVENYTITIDESENLVVSAVLYNTEEGVYLRITAYVDEVNEDRPLDQLSMLLALNLDIPTGAYCLDAEDNVVLVTVNIPAPEVTADLLGWVIEFMIVAQEVYYQEFYTADDMPQG